MYPDGRALLMVGETYNTADVYYVTRYLFPDPAIYLDKGDGDSLIAGSLVGDDGLLYTGDLPVTSERLRAAIDASLLEDNCSGEGTITAWGPDSAQPHNRGQGPIRAGQPIVVDIFPRHNEYRYHADMTRTFSKGAPDPEVARMYEVTNAALDLALGLIRPGTTGRAVFEAVCRRYEDHGYATYLRNNSFR